MIPAWVISLIIKYGVPLAISILEKTGFTNWAEKVAIRAGYTVYEDISGLKTYSKPSDYPQAPIEQAATNNLTVQQPPE